MGPDATGTAAAAAVELFEGVRWRCRLVGVGCGGGGGVGEDVTAGVEERKVRGCMEAGWMWARAVEVAAAMAAAAAARDVRRGVKVEEEGVSGVLMTT